MERITKAMLETRVKRLNEILPINEKYFALDMAYGGIKLVLKENTTGGEYDVTNRATTKEIYNIIDGMLYVLNLQKDNGNNAHILIGGCIDDKHIIGVFNTIERAEEAQSQLINKDKYYKEYSTDLTIESFAINEI